MSLVRHLGCLLAAAIVMIVVGLGMSAAQAHEGHPHRHAAQVRMASAVPAATVAAEAKPAAWLNVAVEATDACGPCCGPCMICGHSGLMPVLAAAVSPPARPVRTLATQAAIPPGLVPEALPKPPRSFA